jgi:hypothetical protein
VSGCRWLRVLARRPVATLRRDARQDGYPVRGIVDMGAAGRGCVVALPVLGVRGCATFFLPPIAYCVGRSGLRCAVKYRQKLRRRAEKRKSRERGSGFGAQDVGSVSERN